MSGENIERGDAKRGPWLLVAGVVWLLLTGVCGGVYWFRAALLQNAFKQDNVFMLKLLLNMDPALANAEIESNPNRLLTNAIHNKNMQMVEILLNNGADVNIEQGLPMIYAVNQEDISMIKILLDYGANPNIDQGRALALVAKNGRTDILDLLLQHGADPRLENVAAAVWDLIYTDEERAINLLINLNIDVHWKGEALLATALYKKSELLIRLLLSKGADPARLSNKKWREEGRLWAEKLGFAPVAVEVAP
jgi:hypothetical protein